MMVKECVKGQGKLHQHVTLVCNALTISPGGLCGAVFVDEEFEVMLRKKFGSARWKKLKDTSKKHLIETEWEHMIKPEFDERPKTWEIRVPFECIDLEQLKQNGDWPLVSLDAEDVAGVFDPVVDKISNMADEQVQAVLAKKKTNPKVSVGEINPTPLQLGILTIHFWK